MGIQEKLLSKILSGTSDRNVEFRDLIKLLINLGFNERIKGSHHIFLKSEINEIINIQESQGKAKPYQVKQVRELILKYKLSVNKNEK